MVALEKSVIDVHETIFLLIRGTNDEILMVDRGTVIFGSLRTFTLALKNELIKGRIIADRIIWVLLAHVVGTIFHMRWVANNEVWIAYNECTVVTHLGNVLNTTIGESVILTMYCDNLKTNIHLLWTAFDNKWTVERYVGLNYAWLVVGILRIGLLRVICTQLEIPWMTSIVPCGGISERSTRVTSLYMVRVAFHILWTTYIDALVVVECYIQFGKAKGGTSSNG